MDTCISVLNSSNDPQSISPQELILRLGQPDAPLLLDVRREAKFSESPRILAGALRCKPEDVAAFAKAQLQRDPRREIVVYCVYGHNVSADAAATLRSAGLRACRLAGGIEGGEDGVDEASAINDWRAHAVPTIVKAPDQAVTGEQPSGGAAS